MGLAYRGIGDHKRSLEALQRAVLFYSYEQTQHAYTQQLLVVSDYEYRNGELLDAESHKQEGIRLLEGLDNGDLLVGGRYYPIVALAEGHGFVTRTMEGDNAAKEMAKNYFNQLTERLKQDGVILQRARGRLTFPQKRARLCLNRLDNFVVNNEWKFGKDLAQLMTTDLPAIEAIKNSPPFAFNRPSGRYRSPRRLKEGVRLYS